MLFMTDIGPVGATLSCLILSVPCKYRMPNDIRRWITVVEAKMRNRRSDWYVGPHDGLELALMLDGSKPLALIGNVLGEF